MRAFLRHGGPTPHSERLHVEDRVLRVDGDLPLALWIGPRSVLVLFDAPDDVVDVRERVEEALRGAGLTMLDEQSPLGIAVGIQAVGARAATWDLWGTDIDEAFADLRLAAVGGDADMLLGGGLPPTGPG